PIRRPFLEPGHHAPWEWRPLQNPNILAPPEQASQVRQDVMHRLLAQGTLVTFQPPTERPRSFPRELPDQLVPETRPDIKPYSSRRLDQPFRSPRERAPLAKPPLGNLRHRGPFTTRHQQPPFQKPLSRFLWSGTQTDPPGLAPDAPAHVVAATFALDDAPWHSRHCFRPPFWPRATQGR